jgi:hypothetical protein
MPELLSFRLETKTFYGLVIEVWQPLKNTRLRTGTLA